MSTVLAVRFVCPLLTCIVGFAISFLSAKALDEYASHKTKAAESNDEATKVDPRLEAIVERMLDKYVFFIFCCGRIRMWTSNPRIIFLGFPFWLTVALFLT